MRVSDAARTLPRTTVIAVLSAVVVVGCTTTPDAGPSTAADSPAETAPPTRDGTYPKLTIDGADYLSLGALVRAIGEQRSGGGIVLVAGVEDRPAPAVSLSRADFGRGVERLMAPANCKVDDAGAYQFVFPPGYEALLDVRVGDTLSHDSAGKRATFAVGAGTTLFNALALLSETVGATIVADNVLGDVWCGEMFVDNAPVSVLIEALLRSARVLPGAYSIEATEHYVFIRSGARVNAAPACLNPEAIAGDLAAAFKRPVDVRLPLDKGTQRLAAGPEPLSAVARSLASQLGMAVEVHPELAEFPVNPAVYRQTPVEDVLDLLVRQWPIGGFGFQVTDTGIRFAPAPAG